MKRKLFRNVAAVVSAILAVVPVSVDAQRAGEIGTVKFDEPYNDPADITAKELARVEGLSLAEASWRLSLMNEAAALDHRLRAMYPQNYAGALAVRKAPFHINFYFVGADPARMREQLPSLGVSSRLMSALKVGNAPTSEASARARAHTMLRQLQLRGIEGSVAWFAPAGMYKLLVKDTAAAATAVRMGQLDADRNVRIEYFEGITPYQSTAEITGGERYDDSPMNNTLGDCTIGFNVRTPSAIYGVTTAGHCQNSGDWVSVSDSLNRYHDLRFQREWISNGIDIQWHTVLAGPSYLIVPKFWNGTSMVTVTGGQSDYAGMFACKYGNMTHRTCGYVDPYQYTSIDPQTGHVYGDYPRINKNPSYPNMSDPGDSGGPIFSGSLAVGHLHGGDNQENVYYTPLRSWVPNNMPITVTCQCP